MTGASTAVGAATRVWAVEVREVSRRYGGVHAVENVSLSVGFGEVLALVGDNGAGKSTLIKLLSGAVKPSAGQILLDGRPVGTGDASEMRAAGVETVYQDLALCPDLSAEENLYLGREPVRGSLLHFLGVLDRASLRRGAADHLESLGAHVPLGIPVSRLSGGQRQVIAIARAAYWGQRLVIFDEPTAALGVTQTEQTRRLIKQVAQRGPGVILISHDLDEVFDVADRIAVLRLGKLVELIRKEDADRTRIKALMAGLA
jgi:simple sugar transport system ATP-binding protein